MLIINEALTVGVTTAMPATVHLFDEIACRKQARWSRPAGAGDLDQFVHQLERLLRQLGDLHLRISLVRLPLRDRLAGPDQLGQAIVRNLQDPCALVGTMPDGSVVAAFLGPRNPDIESADETMSVRIRRRFERALVALDLEPARLLPHLIVAHCWSDEVFDVPSLVLELATLRNCGPVANGNDRYACSHPA